MPENGDPTPNATKWDSYAGRDDAGFEGLIFLTWSLSQKEVKGEEPGNGWKWIVSPQVCPSNMF